VWGFRGISASMYVPTYILGRRKKAQMALKITTTLVDKNKIHAGQPKCIPNEHHTPVVTTQASYVGDSESNLHIHRSVILMFLLFSTVLPGKCWDSK
jgi:hypothetical protein